MKFDTDSRQPRVSRIPFRLHCTRDVRGITGKPIRESHAHGNPTGIQNSCAPCGRGNGNNPFKMGMRFITVGMGGNKNNLFGMWSKSGSNKKYSRRPLHYPASNRISRAHGNSYGTPHGLAVRENEDNPMTI